VGEKGQPYIVYTVAVGLWAGAVFFVLLPAQKHRSEAVEIAPRHITELLTPVGIDTQRNADVGLLTPQAISEIGHGIERELEGADLHITGVSGARPRDGSPNIINVCGEAFWRYGTNVYGDRLPFQGTLDLAAQWPNGFKVEFLARSTYDKRYIEVSCTSSGIDLLDLQSVSYSEARWTP
jgi:hypothetical protein